MSINQRTKGHAFERDMCELLRRYGYHAVTSRSESKALDDMKVDIVDNTKFYFQCKAVERMAQPYHDLLKEIKTGKIPVILHKRNNKGVVAVLRLEDFANLLLYKNDDTENERFGIFKNANQDIQDEH